MPVRDSRMTFGEYAKDWWDWDKCEYLKYRRTRRSISRRYADTGKSVLAKHILPYFSSKKLGDIKPYTLESWLQFLLDKGLSSTSANIYMSYLSVMLTEALRRGLIDQDICSKISPLKSSTTPKGIPDQMVVSTLFSERSRDTIWPNHKSYYANLLSACTGMRMGEILGLKFTDVGEDIVSVTKQFSRKYGLTPTKTKESREIPIPVSLSSALKGIEHVSENDFIFSTGRGENLPLHTTSLSYALKTALEKSGMTKEEIQEKKISFHSWRHYFNTIMRSNNITDSKLQRMTGHKSLQMTDRYTHYGLDDLKEIGDIQAKIVPFSNAG